MSLMNFFHYKYLKQNLKKSKVTLSFILLILPVLTFIMLLMVGKRQDIIVLDFKYVSSLTVLLMYIVPVVVSFLLFHYVFKKKSVDFMGSMPIDRKTIFLTNTIGGIFILVSLLLITTLFIGATTIILPNLYIPFGVCIDYFVVFSISYIFVFTACNIAVSLSGNIATSIVVLLLILFFVPFHQYVFSSIYWNSNFETLSYLREECKEEVNCDEETNRFVASFQPIREELNYTMPFGVFANSTDLHTDTICYRSEVVWKMAVLSLIYILIGVLLFEKKEMEVCETSFKKFWQHELVKVLTLIPIFVLVSLVLYESDMIAWIFAISIVLIYNFIYDLFTKHSIDHILINLVCFISIFMVVSFSVVKCLDEEQKSYRFEKTLIQLKDIEKIQIETRYLNVLGSKKMLTIDDLDIIKEIIDQNNNSHNTTIYAVIDGNYYRTTTYLTNEVKTKIIEAAKKNGSYQEMRPQDFIDDCEVITIGEDKQVLDQEGIMLLKKVLKMDLPVKNKFSIPIQLYKYENHSLDSYTVYSGIDQELQKYVIKRINQELQGIRSDRIGMLLVEAVDQSVDQKEYMIADVRDASKVIQLLLSKKNIDLDQPIYRVSIYSDNKNYFYYINFDEELFSYLDMVEYSSDEEIYVD